MGTCGRIGSLGFALAKGLIRGLVDRYPDPSQPPWSPKSEGMVTQERSILTLGAGAGPHLGASGARFSTGHQRQNNFPLRQQG